jgi:Type II secretion system (T2SS), protein E, N-terminal domain
VSSRVPLEELLMGAGLVDRYQLQSAIGHQRRWGSTLQRALIELGIVSEAVLMSQVAKHLGVEYVEIGTRDLPRDALRLVPEKLIRSRRLLPLALTSASRMGQLIVATSEPDDLLALDEVAFASGKAVKPVLASERDIDQTIERLFRPAPPPVPGDEPSGARFRAA